VYVTLVEVPVSATTAARQNIAVRVSIMHYKEYAKRQNILVYSTAFVVGISLGLLNSFGINAIEPMAIIPWTPFWTAAQSAVMRFGNADFCSLHTLSSNGLWSFTCPSLFSFGSILLQKTSILSLRSSTLMDNNASLSISLTCKYSSLGSALALICNLVAAGLGFMLYVFSHVGHESLPTTLLHALSMAALFSYTFGIRLHGLPAVTLAIAILLWPLDKLLTKAFLAGNGGRV
jgi:hypothetical protein